MRPNVKLIDIDKPKVRPDWGMLIAVLCALAFVISAWLAGLCWIAQGCQ